MSIECNLLEVLDRRIKKLEAEKSVLSAEAKCANAAFEESDTACADLEDENSRLSCENSHLRDAVKMAHRKIANAEVSMTIEEWDMLKPVSEEHNNLTDVEHNNLKTVAETASEEQCPHHTIQRRGKQSFCLDCRTEL